MSAHLSIRLSVRLSVTPAVSGVRGADEQQKTQFGPTYSVNFRHASIVKFMYKSGGRQKGKKAKTQNSKPANDNLNYIRIFVAALSSTST